MLVSGIFSSDLSLNLALRLSTCVTLDAPSQNDSTGLYSHLAGVPKALLPGIGGKKILDFWWETVNMCVSSEI